MRLSELLRRAHPEPVVDLLPVFLPLENDERERIAVMKAPVRSAQGRRREGQGTFRLRQRAYEGQCAVTGEHAMPVLEAAHIQPYLGRASNDPQSGLVLLSDLHRLYDDGYVTVTPDLRLESARGCTRSSRARVVAYNGRNTS